MKTNALLAALLALGGLAASQPARADHTLAPTVREEISMIEQEYARANDGEVVPDNQLEYYLDRAHEGWSMGQITSDIQASGSNAWRPTGGWVAEEVICTSVKGAYEECAAPFRGTAVITQQISQSACVEGRSWGQKPGVIWVNNGCRARFGIVRGGAGDGSVGNNNGGMDNNGGMGNNNGGAGNNNGGMGNNSGGIVPPRKITCISNRGRYRECNTGTRGRVQLVNRLNNSLACTVGRSWGQRPGVVWVNRGCRAQFAATRRVVGPVGAPTTWVRDPNYSVNCMSADGRRTTCTWDTRYGRPTLVERRNGTCLEGRDWGYDDNGQLWVTSACGARFGYR